MINKTDIRYLRNAALLAIVVGVFLAVFFLLREAWAEETRELVGQSYEKGCQHGVNQGEHILKTYQLSAIESGVAHYVIIDKMTGETSFQWKVAE